MLPLGSFLHERHNHMYVGVMIPYSNVKWQGKFPTDYLLHIVHGAITQYTQ